MTTAFDSPAGGSFTIPPSLTAPETEESRFTLPPPGFKPRLERIVLPEPLAATFDGQKGLVIDVSLSGGLIAHQFRAGLGTRRRLVFDWRGDSIVADCEVMRERLHSPPVSAGSRPVYRSGVAFRRFEGDSQATLRQMISELVSRALDERKANARGIPPVAASSVQRGGRNRGYIRFVLAQGIWQREETFDPAQPANGFTVSVDEDPAQIALLCETYERASPAQRGMMRDMARLSTESHNGVPTRRYDP